MLNKVTALHSKPNNIIVHLITIMGNGGIFWWLLSVPFLITTGCRHIGFGIITGMFTGFIIGEVIIKSIVGRTRPSELLAEDELIIKSPRHSSFPSGHSTTSFSVAMTLALNCSPMVFVPAFIIAALIAFSRVYLRVHYFSDVFGGFIIGPVCGIIAKILVDLFRLTAIGLFLLG